MEKEIDKNVMNNNSNDEMLELWNKIKVLISKQKELQKTANKISNEAQANLDSLKGIFKENLTKEQYFKNYKAYKQIDDKRKAYDENWKKLKKEFDEVNKELRETIDEFNKKYNVDLDISNMFSILEIYEMVIKKD